MLGPAIRQDPAYHQFTGPKSTLNVWSNVPFAVIGAWGLLSRNVRGQAAKLASLGVFLIAFGSGYYHAAPDDARLVWDRIPMTLVFTSLLVSVLTLWVDRRYARTLFPLAAVGVASVLWWKFTGDLRPYAAVQFGPALILIPAAITDLRIRPLWRAGAAYAAAKLFEALDRPLYETTGVPGHPLKHLAAALAAYWVIKWISTSFAMASPNPEPPAAATRTAV